MMAPNASSKTAIRHGSCLCGKVRYQVTGEPLTFFVCHCGNCKKATGSAFMTNTFFLEKNVRVFEGKDQLSCFRDTNTASGVALRRYFCSKCGSNVLLSSEQKDNNLTIVTFGTIDDKVAWFPRKERFPEHMLPFVKGINLNPKGLARPKL
ncbi:hypothetical protein K443DRAFT_679171 [Laccaria amethystina LaAM-08-1]|uniref:CENP-V/GFA domain-containing protein n=1 Tax=Laccaria amethystina LaAM-08-1 TaxID=1095629 RepID=A0A0C9XX29_9AGAR|nr:hypothetical protein K443DRAFT_679171 [Laccaria amethystina LaAM-08-1]